MKAQKKLYKILILTAWQGLGLLLFGSAYAGIASQFPGRSFWDLERSLGGVTIPITKTASMDLLVFQLIPFFLFMGLWFWAYFSFIHCECNGAINRKPDHR